MEHQSVRIGIHIGVGIGFDKAAKVAKDLGCMSVQIFTSNPRSFQSKQYYKDKVASFGKALKDYGIYPLVSHASYLNNLAGGQYYEVSKEALLREMERAHDYGCRFVVTHLGSAKGLDMYKALENVASAVEWVLSNTQVTTMLLLENSAGSGDLVGGTFDELAWLNERLSKFADRVAFCIDTAHCWASGYKCDTEQDMSSMLKLIDTTIGLNRVQVFHINDTLVDLGSHKDRHHHIAQGVIGRDAWSCLFHYPGVEGKPFILETPEFDKFEIAKMNIDTAKQLAGI
jgi:deoxyribonuclease-4